MANIKSQKKRNKTNELARQRNRRYKSELKTAIKHVYDAVEKKDQAQAISAAQTACRLFDKAVSKGIIHKNQAANRKSGVMKLANSVEPAAAEAKADQSTSKAKSTTAKTAAKPTAKTTAKKAAPAAAEAKAE
jgi:small subunit ribosomal protein S20